MIKILIKLNTISVNDSIGAGAGAGGESDATATSRLSLDRISSICTYQAIEIQQSIFSHVVTKQEDTIK